MAWNVAHAVAVMRKTHPALFIDDDLRGHAPELEEFNFLPVQLEHAMLRIGQADKRQLVICPVSHKKFFGLRPDDNNLRFVLHELFVIAAQLRQVLLAKRSEKTAIEDEHDVCLAAKI